MVTNVLPAPVAAPPRRPLRPVLDLTRHALVSFLRTPTATFFTLIFPLSFLVIVGSTVGNQTVDGGVRVSQYLVAPFLVFGVAEAAFCVLAVSTATLRDNGVLKRLRGTPIPMWTLMASRIAAAVVMSLLSAAILVTVGVTGYGVEVVWRKAPAALLTLALGIVCCAALGMAVVALTSSVLATQAMTNGVLIPLAFISQVFIVGVRLPTALDWLSRALPLRHFADAMRGTFDPLLAGSGFAWADLGVIAAWAVAGTVVAVWRFGWEPRGGRRAGRSVVGAEIAGPAAAPEMAPAPARSTVSTAPARMVARGVGRPSADRLLLIQIGYAVTGMRKQRLPVFFAIVLPVLLLVLFPAVIPTTTVRGMRFADALLAGMVAYGIAVAGYVNLPEAVASARGAGILKRLWVTPLPRWTYVAGRLASAVLVAFAATVALLVAGVLANDFHIDAVRLPAVVVGVVATGLCFGALGLMLLTLMPSVRSVNAITLGTLVPLSFVSDVFYVGADLPRQLQIVGEVFPLKHAVQVFTAALRPDVTGSGFAWIDLGIVLAWGAAGLLVACRFPWYEKS